MLDLSTSGDHDMKYFFALDPAEHRRIGQKRNRQTNGAIPSCVPRHIRTVAEVTLRFLISNPDICQGRRTPKSVRKQETEWLADTDIPGCANWATTESKK